MPILPARHFKLWKQILLSLLLPAGFSIVVTLYAIYNMGLVSRRITLIEIADDINLNLLELRRYEKNLLLFNEERNVRLFREYLATIDKSLDSRKGEILAIVKHEKYTLLLQNYRLYKDATQELIRSLEVEKRLLEDLRPLGRAVERSSRDKESALELRRFEKNYIIYREQQALQQLQRVARELLKNQPATQNALDSYLQAFDLFEINEKKKEALVARIRETGRAIEVITLEFAARERTAIKETITASKRLFLMAIILLVGSILGVGYLLTRKIVRSLLTIERSFNDLVAGDFSHDVELSSANLPDEVHSFVKAYNAMIHRLGSSREELQRTLQNLEVANQELLERQDELAEAKKISAMRMLASEIAHEINNPLSSVAVFLGAFYEDSAGDEVRRADLSLMINEIRRCQTVLRELVDFARREPLKLSEVSPSKLVGEAIEIVKMQSKEIGINFSADLGKLPDTVVLDQALVYQALVNILTNAYQFSPRGGVVVVRGSSSDRGLMITVTDQGVGIPQENLTQIFRPFFSTRKDIGGSGLGLAITKKIIERHGGTVSVESVPGKETVFTIRLPREQRENDGEDSGD